MQFRSVPRSDPDSHGVRFCGRCATYNPAVDRNTIDAALGRLGQPLPPGSAERFARLFAELERWNRRINLTAITDPGEMITGHLLDSLSVRPLLRGVRVLDVGTGAGFPGLPLAIAEPERAFELIDSSRRKIMFVEHVAGLLGLDNVTAVAVRVEDYAPGHRFDTVIARAVAAMPELLGMVGRHVGEDGVFVAMKGRNPAEELECDFPDWEYEVVPISVPGLEDGSRHAVIARHSAPWPLGTGFNR